MTRTAMAAWLGAGLAAASAAPARAASYEFLAAPETDLNRVYRLDKATGEMGACQYGLAQNTVGGDALLPARRGRRAAVAERIRSHRIPSRPGRRCVPGGRAHRHDVHLLRAERHRRVHAARQMKRAAAARGRGGS